MYFYSQISPAMTQHKLPIREKFFKRDEEVDSTPTIENFIAKGFFPKELVPAFTTEKLARNIHQLVNNAENPHRKDSKCCHYSFPKIKHYRRTLGIPNPLHQIKLCQNLVSNWTDINRLLMSGNLSKSIPSIGSQKRAASPPLIQLP